ELPQTDEAARREILAVHTTRLPLADDLDPASDSGKGLAELAQQTDGLSSSDLAALCQRAGLEEIRAIIESERKNGRVQRELRVSRERFESALGHIRRSRENGARYGGRTSSLQLPGQRTTWG